MTVKVLQPTEIKNYWHDVKYGLEKVLLKTPSAKWIPEDIYADIVYKRSVCVIKLKNEDLVWFFVARPHEGGLFVWAAYSEIPVEDGMEYLINYAKSLNCHHITFQTDRKGWSKVAKKYGFQPSVWKMEL